MELLQKFTTHWKQQFSQLSVTNCKLLVAVSGGLDSVVLANLLHNAGFDFVIAHCNFQLRKEESERDEQFVRLLENVYHKPVLVKRFDTAKYAADNKLSIQEAARDLRYHWFKEIVNGWKTDGAADNKSLVEANVNLIATAHHANDNIETLLINFFRGTGISGLHGIKAYQANIIRPLLFAKREEILAYAQQHALNWVEDSSNASDKYTRNFLRLQLIPSVKTLFPQVEDNLLHNIERFKEVETLYTQAIADHKKKLLEIKGDEVHIAVLKWQKEKPLQAITWEIIKEYGFTAAQVNEVKKLFEAESGSYVASASHRIIRNRNWLIIAPVKTGAAEHIIIEATDKKVQMPGAEMVIDILDYNNYTLTADNTMAALDAELIKFPLLLRRWKQGDYFYPLGMQKKKKLSRFFGDIKLSKTAKENIWVAEMDKKIIWVVGHRIDNRFKITPATRKVLKMTVKL